MSALPPKAAAAFAGRRVPKRPEGDILGPKRTPLTAQSGTKFISLLGFRHSRGTVNFNRRCRTYIDGEGQKVSGYWKMTPILPWLILVGALLLPFIYRQRFRDSSNRSALWLKPDGDGFIFHPFGKLGKAYRVSAAARDLIMAKLTTRTRILYCVMLAAIMPSLALASLDPADFAELRPYLSIARIAVLLLVIAGMWIWHRLAIRPLYADAPESSVRISMTEVRTKKASYTSWTTISLMIARLGLVVSAPTVRYSCGLPCSSFSSVLRQ